MVDSNILSGHFSQLGIFLSKKTIQLNRFIILTACCILTGLEVAIQESLYDSWLCLSLLAKCSKNSLLAKLFKIFFLILQSFYLSCSLIKFTQ